MAIHLRVFLWWFFTLFEVVHFSCHDHCVYFIHVFPADSFSCGCSSRVNVFLSFQQMVVPAVVRLLTRCCLLSFHDHCVKFYHVVPADVFFLRLFVTSFDVVHLSFHDHCVKF